MKCPHYIQRARKECRLWIKKYGLSTVKDTLHSWRVDKWTNCEDTNDLLGSISWYGEIGIKEATPGQLAGIVAYEFGDDKEAFAKFETKLQEQVRKINSGTYQFVGLKS